MGDVAGARANDPSRPMQGVILSYMCMPTVEVNVGYYYPRAAVSPVHAV